VPVRAAVFAQLINAPVLYCHHRLSEALLSGGEFSCVVLYDIQRPSEPLLPGEQYVQGATQDQQCFQDCLMQHNPVSVVFHVAAYGMSGACSLDKKKTQEVNVLVSSRMAAAAGTWQQQQHCTGSSNSSSSTARAAAARRSVALLQSVALRHHSNNASPVAHTH
jgi:hypothetical protein